MRPKFEVNQKVTVINDIYCYSSFRHFVKILPSNLQEKWKWGAVMFGGDKGIIVYKAFYGADYNFTLLVVQSAGRVYIYDDGGIKPC